MAKAIYINSATNETYELYSDRMNLEKAWNLASVVCERNNWNLDMFSYDVKVSVVKL